MNIFEALRQNHDIQREIGEHLIQTSGDSEERQQLYAQYKTELHAHARAEERFFYIPLMDYDEGIDLSRHAIAEHHAMDELIEKIDSTEFNSPAWLTYAKQLNTLVQHHLKEEEHKFFQMAGKILTDEQKIQLTKDYLSDYQQGLKDF